MTTATVPAFCFNCNSGARYRPDGQTWRDIVMCCKLNAPLIDEHGRRIWPLTRGADTCDHWTPHRHEARHRTVRGESNRGRV